MLAPMRRFDARFLIRALKGWVGLSAAVASIFLLPAYSAEPPLASTSRTNAPVTLTPDGKINLKLLYVGKPGSDREQEFVGFLRKHFREVKTGDWSRFDATHAESCDVLILDYPGDGFKAPSCQLPRDYPHPVVTIGVAGGLLLSRMGLKTGYT